jgi:hypothetical protein
MLEFASMSPAEIQFIRLYVAALKREYYLLRSVMNLMHPGNLGIKSFAEATKVAVGLEELQQDFDAKLKQIQKKLRPRARYAPTGPTLDELADIFSLSFFKVITSVGGPETGKHVDNKGWFSGEPAAWKKTLQNYKQTPKDKKQDLPDLLTDFFAAALKFFPFDNKTWLSDQSHLTKKVWPPDPKDWHDEAHDEDDEDFNPFDWFFGDDH